MMDQIVPGGVRCDLHQEGKALVSALLRECRRRFPELVELYDNTASLQDRTVDTGILSPSLARQFGCGGYVGRASGRSFDARRSPGYPPYDALQFETPLRQEGDVDARIWIRIREVEQSLALIDQILRELPPGSIGQPLGTLASADGRGGVALVQGPLSEAAPAADDAALAELAARVKEASRQRLGRTLSIREVDAGSCNGCELEIHALNNIVYDLERFGLRFVASPRHADVLLVTGPVTQNMRVALERTYAATPDPKWVVAVGDCARDGGIFAASAACVGGVSKVVSVDLHIPGCPPSPTALLRGLLALVETVK